MKRLIATPVVLVLGILVFSLLVVSCSTEKEQHEKKETTPLLAEEEHHEEEETTHLRTEKEHRIPQKYGVCVERLSSIRNELTELAQQYRLYQFHEPLELFDAILKELSHKAEADIFNPMRSEIKKSANIINQLALQIDHAGDAEDPEDFLRAVNQLEPVISSLNKFAQFANNQEIEMPHNVPNTFRRMLTRNRGTFNSLKEIASKGYFYKAHEDVVHIKNVADNLEKVFEINVIKNLENTRLQPNISTLKRISEALHESSDKEDRTQTFQTLEKDDFEYSLNNLNQLRSVGQREVEGEVAFEDSPN